MKKHWNVRVPRELIDNDPDLLRCCFGDYTGDIIVAADATDCFITNSVDIGGTHESDDAGSQAAVARLVDLVRRT